MPRKIDAIKNALINEVNTTQITTRSRSKVSDLQSQKTNQTKVQIVEQSNDQAPIEIPHSSNELKSSLTDSLSQKTKPSDPSRTPNHESENTFSHEDIDLTESLFPDMSFDDSFKKPSNDDENFCDDAPHMEVEVLEFKILFLLGKRLGIEPSLITKQYLIENSNTMIPGLHEKLTVYLEDFKSIFHTEWLTTSAVEEYLNLILMTKSHHDTCLFNEMFTGLLNESSEPKSWDKRRFENACRTPFGVHLMAANTIVIPLVNRGHFIMLILDVPNKTGIYFDSAYEKSRFEFVRSWFEPLVSFIWGSSEGWVLTKDRNPVNQPDGHSCGVYLCFFARRYLIKDVMLLPTPSWQAKARLNIALSILCSKLIQL